MRSLYTAMIFMVSAASPLSAAEIFVSAAASLTDAMKEIGARFEKQSGDRVTFNFAASSTLARQIEEGAPSDIFISADEEKMDRLQRAGRIVESTRQDLLGNSLVIVAHAGSKVQIANVEALASPEIKQIALADPQAVPAGIYAKKYLTDAGIWEKMGAKVIPAENVRAALAVVESGNAEIGIVYKTDASVSKKVKVVFAVPADRAPKIVYPVALLRNARDRAAAEKFLAFLQSEVAAEAFQSAGFIRLR